MRFPLYAIVAILALGGCKTVLQNAYQKITVTTPGVENAQCVLESERNKYVVLTPRRVMVERSRLPMTVTCEKAGYYSSSVTVESRVRLMPESQLNVLTGVLPGTAYDVASGAVYDYPEVTVVTLLPKPELYPFPVEEDYVLPKKAEEVQPLAPPVAAEKEEVEKSLSKSLRK